ncbi:hypothetical protein OH738_16965 [Streptomyces hirsutus]|uniref:hypothetical protein n=1 Tax=Streptomyces hirsutus TaxID=35620 RepID=UPI00386E9B4A|nr:hypothetical protein OH738_16965 [Streptomyces hirsutus]
MRIGRILAGTALGAVLAVGTVAVPAHAATAPATRTVSAAAPTAMEFYDDYWTQAECLRVAKEGQAAGMWKIYSCQKSAWDWDLYVGY